MLFLCLLLCLSACLCMKAPQTVGTLGTSARVSTHPGKSRKLRKEFSRRGTSRKMTVVVESHGMSWNSTDRSWTFFNRRIIILGVFTIKLKEYKITVSKTNV